MSTTGASGSYWFGDAGNVTIQFVGFAQQPLPPPPTCNRCDAPHAFRTADGVLWCKAHLDEEQRWRCIESAEEWMTAAFYAVTIENRSRVYKQLAALFHPDQGGDERLMIALNRVRDRFR